jgi:hypothetical protein
VGKPQNDEIAPLIDDTVRRNLGTLLHAVLIPVTHVLDLSATLKETYHITLSFARLALMLDQRAPQRSFASAFQLRLTAIYASLPPNTS